MLKNTCFSGLCSGAVNATAFMILPFYFKKKRGLVFCMTVGLLPIFELGLYQFVSILRNNYGSNGPSIIFSGLMLNTCVASSFYRPVETSAPKEEKAETDDQKETTKEEEEMKSPEAEPSRLQNCCSVMIDVKTNVAKSFGSMVSHRVKILGISTGLFYTAYSFFLMAEPTILMEAGYSFDDVSVVLSTQQILNIVMRFLNAAISDRKWFKPQYVFVGGKAFTAACIMRKSYN